MCDDIVLHILSYFVTNCLIQQYKKIPQIPSVKESEGQRFKRAKRKRVKPVAELPRSDD